jgi:hypothetical protein
MAETIVREKEKNRREDKEKTQGQRLAKKLVKNRALRSQKPPPPKRK